MAKVSSASELVLQGHTKSNSDYALSVSFGILYKFLLLPHLNICYVKLILLWVIPARVSSHCDGRESTKSGAEESYIVPQESQLSKGICNCH